MSRSRPSLLPHWDADVYTRYAARTYDLATRLTGWRRHLLRHALDGLPAGRLLDVGCGTGFLLARALERGFDAFGADPSRGMLEKARAVHGVPAERLFEAPADALPFPDGHFDCVVSSGCLVHVPRIADSAAEIVRVLAPGGLLRIVDHAVPVERSAFTPIAALFSQASGDILHDYPHHFGRTCVLVERRTLGRGGFLQRFDFRRPAAPR